MLIASLAIGIPLMAGNEGDSLAFADYAGLVGGGLLSAALGGVLGVGYGALVGNQVAGVVSVLVYLFVVDGADRAGRGGPVPYTIGTAAPALGGLQIDEAFTFLGSLAVLAGWTALFLAAGLLREQRREVT